ncbi:hypothetical protein pdam_00018447 [Pocillopora damicornis]|uniref:Uncharacterized protein n=1 Tax=Pocillopora damicornis TaxID=46731 RepID=A0A3M6UBH3_POCDA|nr:hypothetical protein pdam_00018447 [Pocillopora damicornis]
MFFESQPFTQNIICDYSQYDIISILTEIQKQDHPVFPSLKNQAVMLSYIRRAQRRRMYERANSTDHGSCAGEPESPSSPSSSENGPKSEGFHFYSSVKKQHSLPEAGAKNPLQTRRTRLHEKQEKLRDPKTVEANKDSPSEGTAKGSL